MGSRVSYFEYLPCQGHTPDNRDQSIKKVFVGVGRFRASQVVGGGGVP